MSPSSWLFSSVERWGDFHSEVEYWSAVHLCSCFLSTVSLLVVWQRGHCTGLCIQRGEQTTETLTLQTLPLPNSPLSKISVSKDLKKIKLMFTSALCVGMVSLKIKSLTELLLISIFSSVHEKRAQHNRFVLKFRTNDVTSEMCTRFAILWRS